MKTPRLLGLLACLALPIGATAGPTPVLQEQQAVAEARFRSEILSTAERYASFPWRGSAENALHGLDPDGVRIDTGDDSMDETGWHLDGSESTGMPYCWGGFTSIEEFHEGLGHGLYAGLVPGSERAGGSRFAMGLDCSGFVSRCWNLPEKQSTRTLGALCYELDSYDQLLPGDALNKFDSHVALFVGFEDEDHTRVRVIEAARIKVVEAVYDADTLRKSGFLPMRYKPLDERWMSMDTLVPSFHAGRKRGRFVADGGEVDITTLTNPLADARPGEWARYEKTSLAYEETLLGSTRLVARITGEGVEVQAIQLLEGMQLLRGATRDAQADFALSLVDFAGLQGSYQDLEIVVCAVETGEYKLGDETFTARRINVVLECSRLVRHRLFPTIVEIDCVQSDGVPLQGILKAVVRTETDWSTDDNDSILSRNELTFHLSEFGG